MNTKTPVIVTKDTIKAEQKELYLAIAKYLITFVVVLTFCVQCIYKPFLSPAEEWQRRSVALCTMQLNNVLEANRIMQKAYQSDLKFEFKSLNNECSELLEEELKLMSKSFRYGNIYKNKDRYVYELIAAGGNDYGRAN